MTSPRRGWAGWRDNLRLRSRPLTDAACPELVATMLAELAQSGTTAAHQRVLRRLLAMPADSAVWRHLGECVDEVVRCLAGEWVGPASGQLPALQDANLLLFADYTAVLRRLGPAALPAVRRLLLGPCAPVNSFGYAGAQVTTFGPKPTALAVLGSCGEPRDCRLLADLVGRDYEDVRVRTEAALVWSRWQPAEAAAAAAEHCLASAGQGTFERSVAPRLALLGDLLVPALLARLRLDDADWLARAAVVLETMGAVAVPGLADFCRSNVGAAALDFASAVLARIDRRAHAVVCGSLADPRRGLSPAESSPDPTRGVGRVPGP